MERQAIDELLAIAADQQSLFTISQAASIGVTVPMLKAAVRRGWIGHERRGVYLAGGVQPSKWQSVVAATLAAGPEAVVSHSTAAAVHHFHGITFDRTEISVPNRSHKSLHDVRMHRSRTFVGGDVQSRNGVQVTAPIRTLIDIAGRFKEPPLGSIIDEGTIARMWTAEEIQARLVGVGRGVAGVADLRQLVAQRLGEGHSDSRLEQRVLRVLKRAAPGYTVHHQVVLDGQVIDMDIAWVAHKIDGEVDGMAVRAASRTKFERQCLRENTLARHGWTIVHFTDKMDDQTLLAQVAPLLGL